MLSPRVRFQKMSMDKLLDKHRPTWIMRRTGFTREQIGTMYELPELESQLIRECGRDQTPTRRMIPTPVAMGVFKTQAAMEKWMGEKVDLSKGLTELQSLSLEYATRGALKTKKIPTEAGNKIEVKHDNA